MAATIEVKYFNSFLLRKYVSSSGVVWNGSTGVPQSIGGYPRETNPGAGSWNIEEARIRGGYNNTNVDYGVKAYLVEDEPNAVNRGNSLIYSGIFNSRTGINNTNVFAIGSEITKSADPANGSIQKLYAEDTNLIVFQESKVSRALIDKDAIYSAEGGGSITNVNTTIGTMQPYAGEFGISRDPGSFAVYGYRKYFTDKDRNAVLRLSMDGLTEISTYGMYDYFRDEFARIDTLTNEGSIVGGWDVHNKQYVLSIPQTSQPGEPKKYDTLAFDETSKGWVSFKTFLPDLGVSVGGDYYTSYFGELYLHHVESEDRNRFYNQWSPSTIQLLLNDSPSDIKSFLTLGYEGSQAAVQQFTEYTIGGTTYNEPHYHNLENENGWYVGSIITDQQKGSQVSFINKEGKWFSSIMGETITHNPAGQITNSLNTNEFSLQGIGRTAADGVIIDIYGCMDVNAETWNAQATIHDNTLCTYEVISGCTSDFYLEYNPLATISDITACNIPKILGCTNQNSTNFNANANQDDDSCIEIIQR